VQDKLDERRRVVLVEDDNLTRTILEQVLNQGGFEVQSAKNASDAETLCVQFDPDAVVLDVDLGTGPNGFDLAESLRISSPGIAILFLTHLPDPRFGGRNLESIPADCAYLDKNKLTNSQVLLDAIDAVLRGKLTEIPRDHRDPNRPFSQLSASQISVLRMIALGYSNQQIATERNTSIRAVYGLTSRAMLAIGSDEDIEGAGRVGAARSYMLVAGIPLDAKHGNLHT